MKWDSEERDLALEVEILEFIKDSKNPDAFPSKKELAKVWRMEQENVFGLALTLRSAAAATAASSSRSHS